MVVRSVQGRVVAWSVRVRVWRQAKVERCIELTSSLYFLLFLSFLSFLSGSLSFIRRYDSCVRPLMTLLEERPDLAATIWEETRFAFQTSLALHAAFKCEGEEDTWLSEEPDGVGVLREVSISVAVHEQRLKGISEATHVQLRDMNVSATSWLLAAAPGNDEPRTTCSVGCTRCSGEVAKEALDAERRRTAEDDESWTFFLASFERDSTNIPTCDCCHHPSPKALVLCAWEKSRAAARTQKNERGAAEGKCDGEEGKEAMCECDQSARQSLVKIGLLKPSGLLCTMCTLRMRKPDDDETEEAEAESRRPMTKNARKNAKKKARKKKKAADNKRIAEANKGGGAGGGGGEAGGGACGGTAREPKAIQVMGAEEDDDKDIEVDEDNDEEEDAEEGKDDADARTFALMPDEALDQFQAMATAQGMDLPAAVAAASGIFEAHQQLLSCATRFVVYDLTGAKLLSLLESFNVNPNLRLPRFENGPLLHACANFGNLATMRALVRYSDEGGGRSAIQTDLRDTCGRWTCGACGFDSVTHRDRPATERCDVCSNGKPEGLGGYCAVFYAIQGSMLNPIRAKDAGVPAIKQSVYCDILRCLADDLDMDITHCWRNGILTPSLISAAENGTRGAQIVSLLLERGADPNERSKRGEYPPLHSAVKSGSLTAVRALMEAGADTQLRCEGHEGVLGPTSRPIRRDALAVELAIESMDMRAADAIFRWEEERGVQHSSGSAASGMCVLHTKKYVDVYRSTGDATGGLGDLDPSQIAALPIGMTEFDVECDLTDEETAALLRGVVAQQDGGRGGGGGGALVGGGGGVPTDPVYISAVRKLTEAKDRVQQDFAVEDKTEIMAARQRAMKQRLAEATEADESCTYCGTVRIGSDLKNCSACRTVAYCNSECQKLHWKIHKKACRKGSKVAGKKSQGRRASGGNGGDGRENVGGGENVEGAMKKKSKKRSTKKKNKTK